MRVAIAVALVACAAGCKKDSSAAATGSAAAAGSCTIAINTAIDGMIAKKKATDQLTPERAERFEKMRGALGARCEADKWPAAMLSCVAAVAGQPELQKCMHDNLDTVTAGRLSADLAQVMFGMRHNNGSGGGSGGGVHFDAVTAFEKRLAAVTVEIEDANKLLATTSDADRPAAKAALDMKVAEKARLEKSLADMKATHGADLKDTTPSTVVPAGSAKK